MKGKIPRFERHGPGDGFGTLSRTTPIHARRLMFPRFVLGEGLRPLGHLTIAAGGERKTEYGK